MNLHEEVEQENKSLGSAGRKKLEKGEGRRLRNNEWSCTIKVNKKKWSFRLITNHKGQSKLKLFKGLV